VRREAPHCTVRRFAPHMKVKRLNLPYKQVRLRRTVHCAVRLGRTVPWKSKFIKVILTHSVLKLFFK
jgi:hypothetical protein